MRNIQKVLLLTIVICALTTFTITSTAAFATPSRDYQSISAGQFTPAGDPIDVPGPPGTPYSPQRG